jgi:adenylosuccinate synthase
VGNGPFPTELEDEQGEELRRTGNEFGATTGRPRRCGWLDLVALRYTTMINGFTDLAITKLDVLSNLEEIKVCTGYRIDGKSTRRFPNDIRTLERIEPEYETLPGWQKDITGATELSELPSEARDYLKFISDYLNVPASIVSSGPKREQTILC